MDDALNQLNMRSPRTVNSAPYQVIPPVYHPPVVPPQMAPMYRQPMPALPAQNPINIIVNKDDGNCRLQQAVVDDAQNQIISLISSQLLNIQSTFATKHEVLTISDSITEQVQSGLSANYETLKEEAAAINNTIQQLSTNVYNIINDDPSFPDLFANIEALTHNI